MLKNIFNKNKCDKSSKHSYDLIYEKDFEKIKSMPLNVLEIGIFRGESISSWVEYFPNARIYGIDIFDRVGASDIEVLKHPRVKYLKADSTSFQLTSDIKDAWQEVQFDIIIDDGLHTPAANKSTLENLITFLKPDGYYYIEDIWPLDEMTDLQMQHPWIQSHGTDYTKDKMQEFLNSLENYTVTKFDNRQLTNEPDSYIYRITK